jgi:epidermal growth factor receptor substrate 15
MNQEGKLNPEQFALAMWLIQQKQAGKDPPAALTPDMVPPSLRSKALQQVNSTKYIFFIKQQF